MKIKSITVLVVLSFLCGCSTTDNYFSNVSNLIIAEPAPINQQSEIALARLSEIINRADVSPEQKARLFYDRGIIFDSVGLRALANFDFQRALRLQPDMVEAYNFIGIHHTQRQQFLQAYEAFDSAIELDPNHQYAYLNRGIALYYGGRPNLAIDDLNTFKAQQQNDPYRSVWLYLVEQQIDEKAALTRLQQNFNALMHDGWANNILRLYLDDISEQEFIRSMAKDVNSHKELTDRLCEGYFYLGKYYLNKGRKDLAADYFKLALSTNVYEFVEHRYAKLELELLNVRMGPIREP
ncbi:lipoprotein NlpI [Thalassotalea aquiviva]|uniref:lipoprotein NlpI n=1 Tax=Thalassotalea aquiviva TaxID=3242415 RepID=UPI003529E9D0